MSYSLWYLYSVCVLCLSHCLIVFCLPCVSLSKIHAFYFYNIFQEVVYWRVGQKAHLIAFVQSESLATKLILLMLMVCVDYSLFVSMFIVF